MVGGSPMERSTPNGMEVTAVYVGPAVNRFYFLSYMFGDWTISYSELGIPCSATNIAYPKHYRFYNHGGNGYGGSCWPDTFSIKPMDDPSPVYVAPVSISEDIESWHVTYDCAAEITINYRTKHMAQINASGYVHPWPAGILPCETGESYQLPCYATPYVTPWTAVSMQKESNTELQIIPFHHLQWDISEPGFPANTSPQLTEEDTDGFPVQVQTTNLEIEWSGVPLPNWEEIDHLKGKLNDSPMWGYPKDSILFANCTPEMQRRWDNLDLWTLRYQFIVKTVESWMPPQTGGADVPPIQPNCFNTMGYWNRKWSKFPVIDSQSQKQSPFRLVHSVNDSNLRPYQSGNLTELFRIKGDTFDPIAG